MKWMIIAIIILIILIKSSIKVVNIMEAYIIERFGKYHKTIENGINFINPFVDKIKAKINLKVQAVKISCKIITIDYKECLVMVTAFSKIINPQNFYYNNPRSGDVDMTNHLKSLTSCRISECTKMLMKKMSLEELRISEKIKLKEMINQNIDIDKDGFEIDSNKYGYKIYDIQIEDICYTK